MNNPLISYLRLLRHIPKENESIITSYFEPKSFKQGDSLFHAGRICREMFFLCSGVLRIMSITDKGVELTHFFTGKINFVPFCKASMTKPCPMQVLKLHATQKYW